MNQLLETESAAFWSPYIIYTNIKDAGKSRKTHVKAMYEVIPNKNFSFTPKDNMHLFKGSENALRRLIENSVDFICKYELHWYPFDTQVCRMEFTNSQSFTHLKPAALKHNPHISLDRYTVKKMQMCRSSIEGLQSEAIVAEETLGRYQQYTDRVYPNHHPSHHQLHCKVLCQ